MGILGEVVGRDLAPDGHPRGVLALHVEPRGDLARIELREPPLVAVAARAGAAGARRPADPETPLLAPLRARCSQRTTPMPAPIMKVPRSENFALSVILGASAYHAGIRANSLMSVRGPGPVYLLPVESRNLACQYTVWASALS